MDVRSLLTIITGVSLDTLSFLFCMKNFTKKHGKGITAAAYLGYWLINVTAKYWGMPVIAGSILNTTVIVALTYSLYEKIRIKAVVKLIMLYRIIIYILELFAVPISMLAGQIKEITIHVQSLTPGVNVLIVVLGRLLGFLFMRWSLKREKGYRYDQVSSNESVIVYGLLIFVWLLLILTGDFFLAENAGRDAYIALLIIAAIAALFIVVYISFIDHFLLTDRKGQESESFQQRVELQLEHRRHMEEDLKNLKILQHDLKNHLLLAENETSYLNKILDKIEASDKYIETGNELLNILLFEKIEAAHEKGIQVELFFTAKDISFMDDIDVCSIFGNIFDNALEACGKITDRTEKTIRLRAATIQEFLMIVLSNDCPRSQKLYKGTQPLETTKKQKEFHGIGLSSLGSAVEKYNGSCYYEQNEHNFKTQILIPVPDGAD